MIIGLTGLPASGKATVSKYLEQNHQFTTLVFSDIIKQELFKKQVSSPNRNDYKQMAKLLRQTHGDGALAKLLIDKIKAEDFNIDKNYILDGIRTMGEVEELKKVNGQIWAVTAPAEKRLKWMKSRNREIDITITLEELKTLDQKELYSANNTKGDLNLSETIKNADFTIENNGSVEELNEKIRSSLLQNLSQ